MVSASASDDGSDVVGDGSHDESGSDIAGYAVVLNAVARLRRRSLRAQGDSAVFLVVACNSGWPATLRNAEVPSGPPDVLEDDGRGPCVVGAMCGSWHLRSVEEGQDLAWWATVVATSAARVGVEVFGHVSYEGEGVALSEPWEIDVALSWHEVVESVIPRHVVVGEGTLAGWIAARGMAVRAPIRVDLLPRLARQAVLSSAYCFFSIVVTKRLRLRQLLLGSQPSKQNSAAVASQ